MSVEHTVKPRAVLDDDEVITWICFGVDDIADRCVIRCVAAARGSALQQTITCNN